MDDEPTTPDPTDDELTCYCRLGGVMDRLSRKYAMQILCVVNATDPTRFRELEEYLPDASTSTMSARLDELAEADLLTRTQYDEIPPRVEYEMTDDGRELAARLEPVLEWAEKRDGANEEAAGQRATGEN
ncbi:helix-turn-helix domain-containing protein [Halorussus sp. MSC15.2]|uniref:winged helix-turn-helix transcriptional regulator n=1 Tax=Halorussus sp. MSC15.2 TaxID=2283638 RepID=UPI0013D0ECC1|nr:helix-turn-helix domain-containing protein [Halorussus sp. MSC15.2]NEU55357.1 helix-turn-helix transcriptional regulator [Halorussus sp. MSC15.2]